LSGYPRILVLDILLPIPFNSGIEFGASETDEKADIGSCLAGLAGAGIASVGIADLGTDQTDAQERDRARRQLRADRPHHEWRTGLFDEVRQHPGAARATAAGPKPQSRRRQRSSESGFSACLTR
jgi:hypothetical protein